jgi:DNA repair exonuclease SbcCD ATPase subunit
MELVHIRLKDFKRFSHFETSFSPGLNVIIGLNEAGKSTLHEAIVLGLLDRPTGKQSEQKHQSWGMNDLSEIKLTYRMTSGELYTIRKDYQKQKFEIIGPEGKDSSRSGLDRAIELALGTTSERLYSSTACIRQDEMMEIDTGGGEISRQLQQIAMGGVSGVDDIIRRLSSKVAEFERGWKTNAPRNPGPLRQLKDQMAEIDGQIGRVRPEVDRRERAKEELQEQRDRAERIERELTPLQALHTSNIHRRDLNQALETQLRQERALEEKLEKVEGAEKRKVQVQKRLENLGAITQIDRPLERELQRANEDYKARSAEALDREAHVSELERQMQEESKPDYYRLWAPIALLILGVMLGTSAALSSQYLSPIFELPLLIIGGSLALAGLIWSVVLITLGIRKAQNLRAQLKDARERLQAGMDTLDDAKDHLEKLLQTCDCDSWKTFEEGIEKFHKLQAELKMAETTLEALLDKGQTPAQLVEKRKEASRSRRDLQEQLKEFKHIPELSPIEFQKVVSTIGSLEGEWEQCREQILKLEALSETDGATLEDLNCLKEREAALQGRLKIYLERLQVYKLTLSGLLQVRDHVLRNAQRELEPRLGRYLERLTQGRYTSVSVDENLQLDVRLNSKHDKFIDVEALSSGTRDQVYLAARLALCDMIFRGAQPPLLLDDPFVTFDSERKEAAVKLCKELSVDRQILLFTCHDDYDDYADNVIPLR